MSINEFSNLKDNSSSLGKRLFIYQKERFPLLGHGLLVASFSFSAIAYSRICRGVSGFVAPATFLMGIITTISLFLLVRIFDEFKDADDDARYRKELPVPRGLVKLGELKIIGWIIVALQVTLNLVFFPKMLLIYLVIMVYLLLMSKEFFVAEWLKRHQFWYVVSHMFIIPLIDIYASGLDWLLSGVSAPKGLLFFFAVSYMNGIVLEVGRKIRNPEREQEGVLTYSAMLGRPKALQLWILVVAITLGLSIAAAAFAGYGTTGFVVLGVLFVLTIIPALLFWSKPTKALSKGIEMMSVIWTIAMYLTLGGLPMLKQLLAG